MVRNGLVMGNTPAGATLGFKIMLILSLDGDTAELFESGLI